MRKKMIGCIIIAFALLLGVIGLNTIQASKKEKADNEKIAKELEAIEDITVMEGDVLPSLSDMFDGTTMIDKDSVVADIQQVDVTTPGEYEIKYTFNDINGGERQLVKKCIVKADLEKHVEGIDDIVMNKGDEIPEEDLTYDSQVDSVVREVDEVDTEKPGSYPITYSIMGIDGDIKTVEKTATVKDVAKDDEETSDKGKALGKDNSGSDGATADEPQETEEAAPSGNVEQVKKDVTVPTGDESPIGMWALMFATAIAAAALIAFSKKNLNSSRR